MKKQIILIITILIVLVSFSIVNASMLDTLASLKAKNCNLIINDYVSSSDALKNKFGLNYNTDAACSFVLDSAPYTEENLYLIYYNEPEYAEINYQVDGSHEYLFLLGIDYTALDKVTALVANYETYQYYLKSYDTQYNYFTYGSGHVSLIPEYFWDYYDPTYTGPEDQNCVDNAIENVYLGNKGSYQKGGTVQFSSSCINANTISYGFCFAKYFINLNHNCKCAAGKCIATPYEIFYYFGLFDQYAGPLGRIIDNNLINSAVSSWVRNY